MATTPALDEFETRITSIVQGAIDERLGPIIERLPPCSPSRSPASSLLAVSHPPPTSLPVCCPVPRPARGRRDPRFFLHTPPGVGVLSHDRRGAVAAQRHQAQGTGTRQHPARGHRVPCTTASQCARWPLPPIAARASGLNLTPSPPPSPRTQVSTEASQRQGISTGSAPSTPTRARSPGAAVRLRVHPPSCSQAPLRAPHQRPPAPTSVRVFHQSRPNWWQGYYATSSWRSQGPPPTAPGTHIGEGLPPVPAKLVARILRHEFVEMHELLPEFWHDQRDGGKTADKAKAKKRALDLTVWLQCFAVYVGVLGQRFLAEVPELMARSTSPTGVRGLSLGGIRYSVQAPGGGPGQDRVVPNQPFPVCDLFHGEGQKVRSVRPLPQRHPQGRRL